MCRDLKVKLKLAFVFPKFQEHRAQPNSLAGIRHLASPVQIFLKKAKKKLKELTVLTPQRKCVSLFIMICMFSFLQIFMEPDLNSFLHSLLLESPEINLLQSAKDIVAQFS